MRSGEGQRGQRGQVADLLGLGPPLRRVMILGARLAQTAGVLEGPLHVSISGVGALVGVGHLEVRSFGFGILCLPLE
jgi:hypothetical protein